MTLRFGLAGLGIHGRRYAAHLVAGEIPGATLTAVCRRDEARGRGFAEQHQVAFVGRAADLADHPDVDAVILVLPPDEHPAAAEACLSRGRPVLVEKPLAPDAARARGIVDAVVRSGAFLMVAHTLRFDAVVQAILREREAIGPLVAVAVNQRFEPTDREWIDRPEPGGLVLNTGVHGFDLLRLLTGLEATTVQAQAASKVTRQTEDQFSALVRLDPGELLATIDNVRCTHSRSGRIELIGERGQIWGDHIHRTLVRVTGRERTDLGPVAVRHTVPAALMTFVEALRDGRPSPITARDGLAALEMVDAARRSARSGRAISIAEIQADS
jgi:myo-inositol 2-dehydrogenase/D-chiro-inositol 1-dehydrogenase